MQEKRGCPSHIMKNLPKFVFVHRVDRYKTLKITEGICGDQLQGPNLYRRSQSIPEAHSPR